MKVPFATTRTLLAIGFLAPLLWVFGGAIFAPRTFVFRDAAHYYYPLFAWAAREWSQGRIPLWNPYENCGAPALADPTASVFYPGKLIFALPLDYATRYKVYILGHVLFAGGAAFFAARRWNATPAAATACGMSYAYGGSVIFQYCNVVYLVGAAWLPLAFWTADGLLRFRRWSWAWGLGAVLAMMVLGGDPQTAYHAGLVALLGLGLRRRKVAGALPASSAVAWFSRAESSWARAADFVSTRLWGARLRSADGARRAPAALPSPALPCPALRWRLALRHRLVLLGGAALLGGLLAAVQILPAAGWTRRSERAAFDAPRTLYELLTWASLGETRPRGLLAELVGHPAAGTHHEHLYQFSVGPWRWAEFLWPNFSGRMFPVHQRWVEAIPAEGRAWTPTLYFGLAPLVAALAAWRLRGGPHRTRWLSWTALLALAAALGWYGIGWIWIELRYALAGAEPESAAVGAPTGGLYWLLVNVLPGYVYFRYPAKWLTVASLALSLLAARGWDATFTGQSRRARRTLVGIGVLSLAGIAIWFVGRTFWNGWLEAPAPDDLLGPLDADGAARDLLLAFVHTAILGGVLLGLMRVGAKRRNVAGALRAPSAESSLALQSRANTKTGAPHQESSAQESQATADGARSAPATLAVLITALDLCLSQGWLAPTAPQAHWRRTPEAAERIAADAISHNLAANFRVFRASATRWLPDEWRASSSADRQREGFLWDHATLYPKYHLAPALPLVESQGSLAAADYLAVLQVARSRGVRRPDGVREPAPQVLALLGARYVLLPRGAELNGGDVIAFPLGMGDLTNVVLWRYSPALPRAWIVDRVERLPVLTDSSPAALVQRTRQALLHNGRWREFCTEAVVETDQELAPPTRPDAPGDALASSCRVVVDQPQRIAIDVNLAEPGLLVLNDLYDADWRTIYRPAIDAAPRRLPLLRTNRVLRGVWLPPGRGRVEFVYRPTRFYWGAALSAAAWLGGLAVLIARAKFGPHQLCRPWEEK